MRAVRCGAWRVQDCSGASQRPRKLFTRSTANKTHNGLARRGMTGHFRCRRCRRWALAGCRSLPQISFGAGPGPISVSHCCSVWHAANRPEERTDRAAWSSIQWPTHRGRFQAARRGHAARRARGDNARRTRRARSQEHAAAVAVAVNESQAVALCALARLCHDHDEHARRCRPE